MDIKPCLRCGVEKPISPDNWYFAKGKPVHPCKPCVLLRQKEAIARDPEAHRARKRADAAKSRTENPERHRAISRRHYYAHQDAEILRRKIHKQENAVEYAARIKARRLENIEERRAQEREQYHRLKANNPLFLRKIAENKRLDRLANPEKHRAFDARKRATTWGRINGSVSSSISRQIARSGSRKRKSKNLITGWTIDELMCHLEVLLEHGMSFANYGQWHIDHVIPLSIFSFCDEDDPAFKAAWSLDNLAPLWASDNISKKDRLDWQLPDTYVNPLLRAMYERPAAAWAIAA